MLAGFLAGCQMQGEERAGSGRYSASSLPVGAKEQASGGEAKEEALFLVVSNNSAQEELRLYNYENELEYRYYYTVGTAFLDKYGQQVSAVNFTPGKAVHIGHLDTDGKLTEVRIAEEAWEYDDVVRFSVQPEEGLFKIADDKYAYNSELFVFSDDKISSLADVTKNDKLSIVGLKKRILSVTVTTGHGTLQLANTELFEGSFLELGRNIFAKITPDMQMEIPEGEYVLTVANDGWGGSCNISIRRGETTTVDLDAIKGEGPSYCQLMFAVDIEGAVIKVDGQEVDYSEPLQIRYGVHSIAVEADGYEDWSKHLYVNSPEATILIELESKGGSSTQNDEQTEGEASAGSTEEDSSGNASTENGSSGDSSSGNNSSGNGSSENNSSGNGSSGNSSSGNASSGNNSSSGSGSGSSSSSIDYDQLMQDYLSTLRWQSLLNSAW